MSRFFIECIEARPDDTDYLETSEDLEKQRRELADRLLKEFCAEQGITDARQVQVALSFWG